MNLLLQSAQSEPSLPKSPPSPDYWLPIQASTFAADIDWLYNFLFWLSIVMSVLILGVMIYFVFKYRAGPRSLNERAEHTAEHNTVLEIAWSVLPMFVLVAIFVWGFKGLITIRSTPKDAVELHAVAQKWKWLFSHPKGTEVVESDELHVPIDEDVRIIIESRDVLHSLYFPSFRTKMDAIPGRYTELWFHATKSGTFPIFCAEYCGTSHSDMLAKVVVQSRPEYDKWLEDGLKPPDLSPIEMGKLMYNKKGCNACHSVDGSVKLAPSWKGLFGKTEALVGGGSVQVDENYLRESITDPALKVVNGFTPNMPSFKGQIKDYELTGIIEYIKSLK
jgi:cytochrome c oxidase subunit 2